MIRVRYPNFLGGEKQILPTGGGDVDGYKGYVAMMICTNKFHDTTDCITIDGYHPNHRNLIVSIGKIHHNKYISCCVK